MIDRVMSTQAPTSAACELYFSLISVNLSTEYLLRKLFRVSFPPSCIFLSWSGDHASMVTDLHDVTSKK